MTRTIPEWPEATWKFDEPVTYFSYGIYSEGVGCTLAKCCALTFGRYAQHQRSIEISITEAGRRNRYSSWIRNQTWPEDGWLVIVKGWHERKGKERIEHRGGVTIHSGEERIELDDFNDWLVRERLELFVDLRDAAIAEGWGPSYAGCACDPPTLPSLHLAHWWPNRTHLTCAPSREQWTKYRQEYYIDHDDNVHDPGVSYNPFNYVTDGDEWWDLIDSLKYERLELARKEKEAK